MVLEEYFKLTMWQETLVALMVPEQVRQALNQEVSEVIHYRLYLGYYCQYLKLHLVQFVEQLPLSHRWWL